LVFEIYNASQHIALQGLSLEYWIYLPLRQNFAKSPLKSSVPGGFVSNARFTLLTQVQIVSMEKIEWAFD